MEINDGKGCLACCVCLDREDIVVLSRCTCTVICHSCARHISLPIVRNELHHEPSREWPYCCSAGGRARTPIACMCMQYVHIPTRLLPLCYFGTKLEFAIAQIFVMSRWSCFHEEGRYQYWIFNITRRRTRQSCHDGVLVLFNAAMCNSALAPF